MSVPPTGSGAAQPLPSQPDHAHVAQQLKEALKQFMEGLENARKQPHLVDSPEALGTFATLTENLHTIALKVGG